MITILSNKEYPVAIFPVSKIFCSGSSSLSKAIFPPWTLHHNSLGKGPGWASPPSVCGCCSHVHLSTDLLPLVLFSSRWNNLFSPKKSLERSISISHPCDFDWFLPPFSLLFFSWHLLSHVGPLMSVDTGCLHKCPLSLESASLFLIPYLSSRQGIAVNDMLWHKWWCLTQCVWNWVCHLPPYPKRLFLLP